MVPNIIRPHFEITSQPENENNATIIEGTLSCCASHDFEIFAVGIIKHGTFSKMYLVPENDVAALDIQCKRCGKTISVFNSHNDGYGQLSNSQTSSVQAKRICCRKCNGHSFSISVKYEYPDAQELKELGISEIDNAFTWIWITLHCNNCGAKYKNFIDLETD